MPSTLHLLPNHAPLTDDCRKSRTHDLSSSECFSDSTKCCNHHSSNPSPHLKHRALGKPLWIDSWIPTSWTHAEIGDGAVSVNRCHISFPTPEVDCFLVALRSCGHNKDIARGITIHHHLVQAGLLEECFDAVVAMYARCGEVSKAQALVDSHACKDIITWTLLLAGYVRKGQGHEGLDCLRQMEQAGILPNDVTYIWALKACAITKNVENGKHFHDDIQRQGLLETNIVLGGALVDMYAKCGALLTASQVLKELPSRNVVAWTTMIAGYVQVGKPKQALKCLEEMCGEGIQPNAVTFVCALKACAAVKDIAKGKNMHDEIARQGLLQNNAVLGSALVDMYAKCGAVSEAHRVLGRLPCRNVVSWNAMIAGYVQEADARKALDCLKQMKDEDIHPNAVTYVCALKACAMVGALGRGKQLHDAIVKEQLLQNDIMLGNALVDMYAKCGAASEAQRVLEGLTSRNVITWNALIAGYTQEGDAEKALNCLEKMRHEGICPDAVTYVSALKACGMIRACERGKQIFKEITRQGLLQNNVVLTGALIDMLAKCGEMSEAERVLVELQSLDLVSWSALIAGYTQEGHAEEALNCFQNMQRKGILPDAVTYISVLKACAILKDVDKGKQVHDAILRNGLLQKDVLLGAALMDMYAKCGDLLKAQQVLEKLPTRDVVSWSTLISGYAQEDKAEEALNCFEQMLCEGILPNVVTCACVLNMYSHRGQVEDAQMLFANMSSKYGIAPSLECYTCMIDLYGRAGHLQKAARLIQEMPFSNYMAIWHALLSACLKWVDVSVGEWAFEQALNVDKSDGPVYVLMTNIYRAAGMEEKAKMIEAVRISNRAYRTPSHSKWNGSNNVANICYAEDLKSVRHNGVDTKLGESFYKVLLLQRHPAGLCWEPENISSAAKIGLLCCKTGP